MNATEAKNARHIRCKRCNEPLAIIDAYTWDGFYYCPECFEGKASLYLAETSNTEESK